MGLSAMCASDGGCRWMREGFPTSSWLLVLARQRQSHSELDVLGVSAVRTSQPKSAFIHERAPVDPRYVLRICLYESTSHFVTLFFRVVFCYALPISPADAALRRGIPRYGGYMLDAPPPHSLPRKGTGLSRTSTKGLGIPFLEHYRLRTPLDPGSGTNSV